MLRINEIPALKHALPEQTPYGTLVEGKGVYESDDLIMNVKLWEYQTVDKDSTISSLTLEHVVQHQGLLCDSYMELYAPCEPQSKIKSYDQLTIHVDKKRFKGLPVTLGTHDVQVNLFQSQNAAVFFYAYGYRNSHVTKFGINNDICIPWTEEGVLYMRVYPDESVRRRVYPLIDLQHLEWMFDLLHQNGALGEKDAAYQLAELVVPVYARPDFRREAELKLNAYTLRQTLEKSHDLIDLLLKVEEQGLNALTTGELKTLFVRLQEQHYEWQVRFGVFQKTLPNMDKNRLFSLPEDTKGSLLALFDFNGTTPIVAQEEKVKLESSF